MFPVSLGLWHFDLLSGVKIAHPRGGRGAGGGGWGGSQSLGSVSRVEKTPGSLQL